jgi:integrase
MENEKGPISYPYRVIYPTPEFLEKKGFGRVAHLPFILDARPGYHRIANQFLIDLGLGEWNTATRGTEQASTMPPTRTTMHNYAHWLVNYLEYCHVRGKDPLKAEYKVDLVQGYQGEMTSGSWSRDNTGLAAKTVNSRVDVACMFLQWAVDKGLREPFHIPKVRKTFFVDNPHSSGARTTKTVEARRGKVREAKRRLGFPDEKVISAWLSRVREKCPVEGLIAELILDTAVRRAEAAAWRVDTLPLNPDEWNIVNQNRPIEHQAVQVVLRYETKGHDFGKDHGDKIGPEGDILVPMPFALKLHEYRQKIRPKALTIALRKAENVREAEAIRQNAVHLFLNPATGVRYVGQQIYDFWTSENTRCPRGWSPHLARDFWACSVLWKHIEAQQTLVDQAIKNKADPSVLKILALNIEGFIQLTIQRQLRHVSRETTMIYLQWVSDRLGVNMNFHENYRQQLIEEDVGEKEDE